MQPMRGLIIGSRSILFVFEITQIGAFPVGIDIGYPPVDPLIEANALELRKIASARQNIALILLARNNPQIFSPVVQRIVVDMVDNQVFRSVHNDAMHHQRQLRFPCARLSVWTAGLDAGVPTTSGTHHERVVFSINCRDQSFC